MRLVDEDQNIEAELDFARCTGSERFLGKGSTMDRNAGTSK